MEMGAREEPLNCLCGSNPLLGRTLYQGLIQKQTMSFKAWSDDNAWQRSGEGALNYHDSDNQLILTESGYWSDGTKQDKHYQFINTWLYQFLADRVILSHLRLGRTRPVRLCELQSLTDGVWSSVTPHYCGEDIYSMRIDLRSDQRISIDWHISGNKAERKQIIYR